MNTVFTTLLQLGIGFLFGTIFIIASLLITNNQKKKNKRCISSTKGKVINLVESSRDIGHLHPVFEYTINEKTIQKTSSYSVKGIHFFIGQEIEIHYNPLNHNDYFVVEEIPIIKTITKGFLILGGLFAFVGFIFIILAMILK